MTGSPLPQFMETGQMMLTVADIHSGRIVRMLLEDDQFDIIWRGRVMNNHHGGNEVDCSVSGQWLMD